MLYGKTKILGIPFRAYYTFATCLPYMRAMSIIQRCGSYMSYSIVAAFKAQSYVVVAVFYHKKT